MHPHLIDWFRDVHIHPDPKEIERRWKAAKDYITEPSRSSVIRLLRLFLFEQAEPSQNKAFTDELLALDPTFPVAGNDPELRVMAGVIMVAAFQSSSKLADAFGLGLQAAAFPGRKMQPAKGEIVDEAQVYIDAEAERMRPGDFVRVLQIDEAPVLARFKAIRELDATNDEAISVAESAFVEALAAAVQNNADALVQAINRLAEESALLWWVFGAYSTALHRRVKEFTGVEYALTAAGEAAERTHVLPPPHSAGALLARALDNCSDGSSQRSVAISDFIGASEAGWRKNQLGKLKFQDCSDLLPITTGLAKFEELRDMTALSNVLSNVCPGVNPAHELSPAKAAHQFYNELMFLDALGRL
jgi:hypothetical protein